MPKFIVIQGPVEHDGQTYHDGDELNCKAEAAQPLLNAGVLVQPGRKPAGESGEPKQA